MTNILQGYGPFLLFHVEYPPPTKCILVGKSKVSHKYATASTHSALQLFPNCPISSAQTSFLMSLAIPLQLYPCLFPYLTSSLFTVLSQPISVLMNPSHPIPTHCLHLTLSQPTVSAVPCHCTQLILNLCTVMAPTSFPWPVLPPWRAGPVPGFYFLVTVEASLLSDHA